MRGWDVRFVDQSDRSSGVGFDLNVLKSQRDDQMETISQSNEFGCQNYRIANFSTETS